MVTTRAALQAVPAGSNRHALKLERFFSTEGVHPYDELEWELRDAVVTDWRTGEPSFEQRDVEFPSTWSANATTIVAQKYFRGTLGTPQRERSVQHMIDRVADTITGWGRTDGYFADDDSAEVFNHELKHLLVNQKAAFNSPVWFNVGVEETPQCSACQPWDAKVSTPEGLVPIGQLVSDDAVGTKVYDAHGVTKVIATKHNGRKQVLRIHLKAGSYLDVTPDHLVWRAADSSGRGAFVEAGDLRPGDRLQWQRTYAHGAGEITDTAMAEAALAGWLQAGGFVGQDEGTHRALTIEALTVNDAERDWVLAAIDKVLPGAHRHERRVETRDGALDCRRIRIHGDGLSDFVERWGLRTRGVDTTVPEHLFTAPLPVVAAYLRSVFQAEGYVQVRERSARIGLDMISEEVVRGVQALLLRFGIFCRVAFNEDTRPDRHGCWSLSIATLGDRVAFGDEIGFLSPDKTAELEASLALEGKPSQTFKTLAIARIEDRGEMDVYDIQTESGEYLSGNLRVHNCFILSVEDTMSSILNWYVEEGTIFKGGSGSGVNLSKIRSSKEKLKGGGEASGPVSFMRGADASAGTIKCLHQDTEIVTDAGVRRIADVVAGTRVLTRHGYKTVEAVHDNGVRDLVRVRTALGDEVLCTPEHRFWVRGADGEGWREAKDLREDDHLVLDLSATGHGSLQQLTPVGSGHHNEIARPMPAVLDEAMGLWLGWFFGDGSVTESRSANFIAVQIGDADPELADRYRAITRTVLGDDLHLFADRHADKPDRSASVRFCSTQVIRFLRENGLLKQAAADLRVPELIKSSPATVRAAFLSGLFEADGHIGNDYPWMSTVSAEFARAVHRLLLSIGIPSTIGRIDDRSSAYGEAPVWTVRVVAGEGVRRFAKLVGFVSERKSRLLEAAVEHRDLSQHETQWALPFATGRFYYVPVTVESAGRGPTSDLTVEDVHEYLVHNLVTHNSGGKTRRAAKMVILDVDHPDIEEFIWCKAREEAKVKALREAGFDMDLDGEDYASIQYQNANNSVRVDDAFMRAVEADRDYDLVGVTDGEVKNTVKARDLMRQIAQAAWDCADPGVQYDTTINDWHTTPNAGRINGSNPCCFTGDTLVDTAEGLVTFEVLEKTASAEQPLPRVRAFDLEHGQHVTRQVTNVWVAGHTDELLEITTEAGLVLRCTPEHRFLAVDGDYIEARDLAVGQRIRAVYSAGSDATDRVAQVASLRLEEPMAVYDLEVEGTHNFAVTASNGDRSLIVHNSEYMHLDNSACNLASLNLRKFESGGVFDVEAFKRAVEIVFTAQEIIVGNSSYPTPGIGENARAYRQLGLGYANLGGLLMSQGLAYDSDEGRAWAGAITALMTGHAYRTSAELAQVQGPFDGYAKDRDGMLRVIAKHKDAADELDDELAPANILEAAKQSWADALSLGTKHGIRNAQASVLAPTGCLVGGTLVPTERGLVRLGSLGDPVGEQWQDLDVEVATDEGPRQATKFYVNGLESVVTVDTARGYRIQGTPKHRIKVVQPDGSWVWKRFGDLDEGDQVPLALDQLVGEPQEVRLPGLADVTEDPVRVPAAMSSDLAELVGFFMGAGSLDVNGLRLCVATEDFEVVDHLGRRVKQLFGVEADVNEQTGYTEIALSSPALAAWWKACGFAKQDSRDGRLGLDGVPTIPDAVLHSNDRAVYAAFVRGLFEAEGDDLATWSTSWGAFSHDVQSLLLALGIATTRTTAEAARFQTTVDARYVAAWAREVGFLSGSKQAAVKADAGAPRTGFLVDTIASAELGEDELTYDLSVPDNVTYVANGFVSHNTIGLMMDCDTTGIEPDLGLVKMKKMVGGGSMRIVNRTVPVALEKLGYQPEQIEAIIAYIDEHSTIEGAPAFREEHLPVFDCAMGERSISAMGHVRMMSAVQPFISGAISKCVVGETLVTTEDGLVRIESLHQGEAPDTFRDEVIGVASLGGTAKTDAFYYGGTRNVRKAVLRSGHTITGTENHRVLTAGREGIKWGYLDELQPGEHVAVQYGNDMWSQLPARFDDFTPGARSGSQKAVTLPEEMTAELAFLLGAYVAEGHTTRSTWTVSITNACEPVLTRVAQAWRDLFGVEPVINRPADRCANVVVASKTIVEFLEYLGCGTPASAKRIPDAVLRSPRPMVLAFLQGLFLDAYASVTHMPKLALRVDAPQLLDDYQAVLTNLGIVHGRSSKQNTHDEKSFDEVYAVGQHAARLARLVPFMEPEKAARAARLPDAAAAQDTADIVPGLRGKDLVELIPGGQRVRSEFAFLHDPRTQHVSRRTLERVAAVPGVELPPWLRTVLDDNLHFSRVESVEDAGEREVYDVSVPTTHAFVGNGVVNHNTVNLPESATVEDVEEMYIEGWKLGLKAIAIYRDNCKAAQPLSLDKKKTEAEPAATSEQAQIVRRRLPKQRPSQTLSFQVGDAEGYLTAGEYPGNGLGEIFVKLGKQGSTLSGVMDAFAISVSLGLQYGVPLEAYVSKFTNMRFDPAGMTDDPEVKFSSSIVDYIFRRLAIEYLPADKRHELGIYTLAERNAQLDAQYGSATEPTGGPETPDRPVADAEGQTVLPIEKAKPINDVYGDAPMCFSCGVQMVRSGSCHVCQSCGTTSGCS